MNKLDIETTEELKKVLEEIGYSLPAITEIMKWYAEEEKKTGNKNGTYTIILKKFLKIE